MIQNTGATTEGLGLGSPIRFAGAPVNGTDEVQRLTITGSPTGGTITLSTGGFTTAPIAYNAAAADVQAALELLSSVKTGNVVGSGGALPGAYVDLTFAADLGRKNVPAITVDASGLTGGSSPAAAITNPTPGVDATARGAAIGAELVDTTTGNRYVNLGTPLAPSWTVVSPISGATAAQIASLAAGVGTVAFDRTVKVAKVPLVAAAGVLSWANPEAGAILVQRVMLDLTTIAAGACSVSVGTTSVGASTTSANLIDTLDVHSAIGVFDNLTDAGSNGKARQKLASGKWVTATVASGTATGLAGYLYIHYINV